MSSPGPSSPLPSPPPLPPASQPSLVSQPQCDPASAPSSPSSPLPAPPPIVHDDGNVASPTSLRSVDGIEMKVGQRRPSAKFKCERFAVPSPINTHPLTNAAAVMSPPKGVRTAYVRRQSMSVFSPLSQQTAQRRAKNRNGKQDHVTPMTGYQEDFITALSPGQGTERGFFSRESRYLDRYMFLLVWLGFLVAGWGSTRLVCVTLAFPSSCNGEISGKRLMEDIQALFLFGMVMAWMCSLTHQWRFWNLFSKRRWYFFVVYIGTIFAFPGLTTALRLGQQASLTSGSQHGAEPPHWIVLTGVGVGGGLLVVWHVWHARANFRQTDVICYAVTRLCVLAFYTIQAVVVLSTSSAYVLHFHHWLIGFALSLFCQFDHWVSVSDYVCNYICM
jgi:hypothetical protein